MFASLLMLIGMFYVDGTLGPYYNASCIQFCQVDEQWFDLSADLLRKALAITPVIPAHPFELPPSGNIVIDFVNELGYPEPVEIVSNIRVNYVYQPWRAILTLINQCLTGKTSGSDKPRHPVLQMLWGIVTQTNVDHAELIWEEFYSRDPDIFLTQACHNAIITTSIDVLILLFITLEMILVLGILTLCPIEMVAENTKKTPQESASVQSATKRATPKKHTTTTPVKQSKPAPPPTKKPSKRKLPHKVRKGKPTFQLVDEDDEAQQKSIHQEEGNDPDLELAKKMSLEAHQEKGEGEGIQSQILLHNTAMKRDQSPHDSTTGPSSQPEDDTSEKVIHESSSTSDSERTESETETAAPKGDKDQGEVDSSTVTSGVSIPVSDPEKAHEALAGPDPEPMKEDQTGSDSGKLHKVISAFYVSMKNLDDTFNFGDQFLYDKPTEDDQEKSKVREESESTIPDPNQTVTSTPPVIAPFTDVSSSKPSLLVQPKDRSIRFWTASGSAQHPPKLMSKFKENREFWCILIQRTYSSHLNRMQITRHKLIGADYSMHRSDPESEHSEQSSDDIPMKDEGNDSDMEDTDNASHTKCDKERKIAYPTSALSRRYLRTLSLQEVVPSLWVESDANMTSNAVYGITTGGLWRKEFYINQITDKSLIVKQSDRRCEFSDTYPILLSFTHCGNKSILRVLRIILVILPEHPSETMVFHNEDGNPARANIKQALGYLKDGDGDGNSQPHKGVKASANSNIMYFFTSAQDGDPLQDDVRLCLGDDLKKAQDHSQRQV
ncbi:hypothetical protein Tco_0006924 [Tanacetum coccineum]